MLTSVGSLGYQLFKSDANKQSSFYIERAGPSSPGGMDPKDPKKEDHENNARTEHFAKQSKAELLKSRAPHEKLIKEHQTKLADYIKNPDACDNLGLLKKVSPDIRQKIIAGRVKELNSQITRQTTDLTLINNLLKEC